MRRMIRRTGVAVVLGGLLMALSPAIAQAAWDQVDRDVGYGRAVAAGWTENYSYVHFYGGHRTGQAGSFSVTWSVQCNGGFSFFDRGTVSDTESKYWGDTVRIPGNQGRCRERFVVRDYGHRMIAVIEARKR